MAPALWPALVADIGGTNARFALIDGPGTPVRDVKVLATADYPTLPAAIESYLEEVRGERPRAACLAVAGPVTGDEIKLTNRAWEFSIAATRDELRLAGMTVLNDFEALALALPRLEGGELLPVGGGDPVEGRPKAVLGPGTGLGVAGVVPSGNALAGARGRGRPRRARGAGCPPDRSHRDPAPRA